VATLLLAVDLVELLLPLNLLGARDEGLGAVLASTDDRGVVTHGLVGPHLLLVEKVIGGGDGVVAVRLEALHGVL